MRLAAKRSPMKPNEGELPHILIVGGGVAGLILATRLGHSLVRGRHCELLMPAPAFSAAYVISSARPAASYCGSGSISRGPCGNEGWPEA